jgi:hypothetical protein
VRWFLNFENQVQQPILLGFIGGETAKALEKKFDAVVKAEIMAKFREYFGAEVPEPTGFLMTGWSEDLYTQGAYLSGIREANRFITIFGKQ